jgi:hypothetical protein
MFRMRNLTLSVIVEKCLSSNRAGTKQISADILLEFIDNDSPSPVVDEIISGFKAKQPKAVASCVSLLKEVVRLYGARTVDVKPILKQVSVLFGHPDAAVRAETSALCLELFKWISQPPFDAIFKDLKPVQVTELQESFACVSSEPKPSQTRFLKSQVQHDQKAGSHSPTGEEVVQAGSSQRAELEKEIDPFDLIESVDVLSKVPSNLEESLGSSKWKDRKDALDELEKILDVPKYDTGDFSSLIALLSKVLLLSLMSRKFLM